MSTTKDALDLGLSWVEICNPRLWMSASYKNTYISSAPGSALDVTSPGTGWYDMGNVQAIRIPVTKDVFDFKRGIPKTSRKMWEVDRTAQITFNTAELSPYVEAFIMGQSIYNTLGSSTARIASPYAAARSKATTASQPGGFLVDDILVCASANLASLKDSYNLSVVESYAASVLTLEDAGFPVAMVAGDSIRKVNRVAFIDKMGTDLVRSAMVFWDTNVDSSGNVQLQHVLYFPKLRNFAGGELDFKDSAEPYETAVTLSAQAVNMTYDDSSTGYNFYKKWVLAY